MPDLQAQLDQAEAALAEADAEVAALQADKEAAAAAVQDANKAIRKQLKKRDPLRLKVMDLQRAIGLAGDGPDEQTVGG